MAKQISRRKLISSQRLDDSASSKTNIVAQAKELFPLLQESTERAAEWERWYRDEHDGHEDSDLPVLPPNTPGSVEDLRDFSPTPWGKMISDGMSQDLILENVRQKSSGADAPGMRLWQQNGLDSRQKPVHDGAIRHGKAFNLIGKAYGRLDGLPTAFIRGKSALVSDAFFRDDFDEYPEFFMERHLQRDDDGSRRWRIDFFDDSRWHRLTCEEDGSHWQYIDYEYHEMNICPVVRLAGNLDLNGRATGEIEPYVKLFKRINQGTMDRLVVQRHGAHLLRWISSALQRPALDAEARAAAIALGLTDLMMLPPDASAGTFAGTPLDGYVSAREADVRDLSATSQTPSFHMLGLSDNVGAEGLAAAEASHMRKIELWKTAGGEFWETSLRLGGWAAGIPEIANDFESRAHWKDTSAQSFQSFAQGLQTLAEGLGIPGEVLWPRVLEQPDIEQAKKLKLAEEAKAEEEAEVAQQRAIEIQAAKGAPSGNAG